MTDPKAIKKAFKRCERALKIFPFLGPKTNSITVRSGEGLSCEVDDGSWKFNVDVPSLVGGGETAPTPEMYEAGALGSCLSITARMWAAKLEIPIESIKVEVEYKTDRRLLFNIGDAPPHWQNISYHVTVESPATEEEVMRVLDMAHSQSHVRADFEHAFDVKRTVTINTSQIAN
ncbi:MAG TPA: OsmC family protein [Balneolaceae bacterium]|nr:OsmC family protein [Balneolaceae bacterium]